MGTNRPTVGFLALMTPQAVDLDRPGQMRWKY
jgi:hypothetical protein